MSQQYFLFSPISHRTVIPKTAIQQMFFLLSDFDYQEHPKEAFGTMQGLDRLLF